jgi:hypothetical protein
MKLEQLIMLATNSTTLHEVDWVARQISRYGDEGIDALIAHVVDKTSGWRGVARCLAVLGSMHVVNTAKVSAAVERILLTRHEVELHRAVLPTIIVHGRQGREDAVLAVNTYKHRGGEPAERIVAEAYKVLEGR